MRGRLADAHISEISYIAMTDSRGFIRTQGQQALAGWSQLSLLFWEHELPKVVLT